ncbi:ABC transporter substrate-binding protein [Rhodococcus sp. ARC_M6]|uniref:ABC transporter substrate-binding protein n=1 Tax=Rhodococcus sp. ARC_M6 TaxID=2928852 RepID=UPI001FB40DE4|nr:extracellular solute-binding protein [Rhodococcus sp. ARC_M6]MCJ0906757.1 extracellular solute-binding protein [Rhodococcus sp. ARC_M6]
MKNFPRSVIAVTATATLLMAVACSSDETPASPVAGSWDDVVAAANVEGSVRLYSTQHPANLEALRVAFTAQYPQITLEVTRGTDVEMNPRIETENRTGKGVGDVHMSSDPSWIRNTSTSGAFSTAIVGPAFDDPAYERDRSVINNQLFLTSAAIFALGWNTDAVPQGLQSPDDLLDPALKGKIGVVNPGGFAAVVDQYQFFEKNWGTGDFNERLAAQSPRIYPSSLGIAQALSSGEIVATPMVQPLVREMAAGAPVNWVLPEPAWGTPWYSLVLASAPHPNAAQVLANFLVTEAGQKALSYGYGSALPDISGSVGRAQDIALPDTASLTPELTAKFQEEWERGFQR